MDKRSKLRKMDMGIGTWNIRSLYRAGSLMTVGKETSNYNLHFVEAQEIKWDRGGTEPAGEYTFYGKGNGNHEYGTFFPIKESSAVKGVESVSDRMSYIMLRGLWCDIIILNVHAPT
jgi:hypothetical protein